MGNSKIPWLKNPDGSPGKTWPLAEGCTKVSAGCLNCCAERAFNRWHPHKDFRQVRLKTQHLEDPFHWKKPQRILVDFMFDLFHPQMSYTFIAKVFAVMAANKQHKFLILTKRPEIMKHFITDPRYSELVIERLFAEQGLYLPEFEWPLPNVWLGVSVEDQATADNRIPYLLSTPSALRFISYEPAIGPVDLISSTWGECKPRPPLDIQARQLINPLAAIDWLIMGCESGPGARPMDIEWARSVRDQCQAAGVPFFFKQQMVNGKLVHMPELDGQIWAQLSEEHLEELVKLAADALLPLSVGTSRFNSALRGREVRTREKYRRLSFELAGELAKEVLEFRALVKIVKSGNVSAETIREEDRKTLEEIFNGREI